MNKKGTENYLEFVPMRKLGLSWTADEKGIVTLSIENKGFFNKLAQRFFKKPPISYVHLDEFGSFVWQIADGKRDIAELGKDVELEFGEKAEPLYPRLAKFFQILDSYGFIELKKG